MTNLKNRYPHNTTATDPSSSFSSSSSLGTCLHNYDGSVMKDHRGRNIYRSQYLCSHPLMSECEEKIGYDGRQVVYMADSCLIRNMNLIFGYDGWSSEVIRERVVQSERNEDGEWIVGYIATVRLSLTVVSGGGATHEDCGSGEARCESLTMAHEQAIQSAISEGIRRAARQFGERLGNALCVEGNALDSAPGSNVQALEGVDEYVNKCLFGKENINASSNKDVSKNKVAAVRGHSDGFTESVTDDDDDEVAMTSQDSNSKSNQIIKLGESQSTISDCSASSQRGDDTPMNNTIVPSVACRNEVNSKYQLESLRPEQVERHAMVLSKEHADKKGCQWSMDRPQNDSHPADDDATVVEDIVPVRSHSGTRTPTDWTTVDGQNKESVANGAIVGVDKHVENVISDVGPNKFDDKVGKKHCKDVAIGVDKHTENVSSVVPKKFDDKVGKNHLKHASWSAFESNSKDVMNSSGNLFTSPAFEELSESGAVTERGVWTHESSNCNNRNNGNNRNNSNKYKLRSPSPLGRRRSSRENSINMKKETRARSNSISRSIFRR